MAGTIRRKIIYEAELETGDVTEGLQEVEKAGKKATGSLSGGFSLLDNQLGGLPSKIGAAVSGVKTFAMGMRGLNAVIAASGIGLLVTIVAALTAAFRSSEEGQNKFAKIMGVIGSVTDNLVDLLADLGEKIIWVFENPKEALNDFVDRFKQGIVNRFEGFFELIPKIGQAIEHLFAGEFAKAAKVSVDAVGKVVTGVESVTDAVSDAVEAVAEFGEQVVEEGRQAAKVAEMRAEADKIERDLLVKRARMEAEVADLRLKAREEEKYSAEERKGFIDQALALQESLTEEETKYLTLRAEAQSLENTFARSNKENLDKEAQALAAVEQVQVRRLNQQREFQEQYNTLNKQIEAENQRRAAEEKARLEAEKKAAEERQKALQDELKATEDRYQKLQEFYQSDIENEIDAVARKYDELFLLAEEFGYDTSELIERQEAEVAAIEKKYAEERKQQTKKEADDEVAMRQAAFNARLQMAANTLQALSALNDAFSKDDEKSAERAFKRNKALSIATAVVQTAQAVTAALTAGGNPLKLATGMQFVEAGIAAAVGAAQIATIARQEFTPMGGGGDTSIPSVGGAGTSEGAAPQLDLSFMNQDGSGASIPRAYVVSQDVTSSQQAEQLVNDQASLLR